MFRWHADPHARLCPVRRPRGILADERSSLPLSALRRLGWYSLTHYPIAVGGSVAIAHPLGQLLELALVDVLLAWAAAVTAGGPIWYRLEPLAQRLWGARTPVGGEREQLNAALSAVGSAAQVTGLTVLVSGRTDTRVSVGLRTIVLDPSILHEADE